ncbi:hypothetical protein MCP_0872 [Methanocella paludicola SANAE]|uniref:DUF58 domain-containing protein n=1 Tax=Methanocella paludicola (strain DSM 17711 / JCM 13418 / NBRC 101707 / SANAE) TaxID=304371 RepID=D1YWX2_METPS|nr:DUF58 domain-containing protein [Methanocella paludicola]BAI60944.1 hypothetical protein MCP_0872 [Methanocella paludicola SANAE]
MELKDSALPMLASALALLLLALVTGSLLFYTVFTIILVFIASDALSLLLAASSLERDLSLSSSLSRPVLSPGMRTIHMVTASYSGKLSGILLSVTPVLDDSLEATPPGETIKLRKGEERTLSMDLFPLKPGDYTVGTVEVRVSSLLFAITAVAGEAKVLRVRLSLGEHMLRPKPGLHDYQKNAAAGGSNVDKQRGSDFYGVRLYMPGDAIKNIDWALSSRAGKLVVREFEADRTLPAYFLVDLSPRAFESSIAIVSGLIDRELYKGEKVGLICFSRSEIVQHVRPGMGREHIRRLSDVLSKLHAVDDRAGAGPCISISEVYDAGHAIQSESGIDVLKPVIEETFKGYLTNVREDGFIKAILSVAGDLKNPCDIRVVTGLSMGLPGLMNGLRLARYHGHSARVILCGPPGPDHERIMELAYAEKKLRSYSIDVTSAHEWEKPEGRIRRGRGHIRR